MITNLTSLPPCAKAPKVAVNTWRKENSRRVSGGGGTSDAAGGGLVARSRGAALELGVIAGTLAVRPSHSMLHALPSGP